MDASVFVRDASVAVGGFTLCSHGALSPCSRAPATIPSSEGNKGRVTRVRVDVSVIVGDASVAVGPPPILYHVSRGLSGLGATPENLRGLSKGLCLTTLHAMAKKATSPAAKVVRESPDPAPKPTAGPAKPSSLVDTRVIWCGDCLEQLKKLPDACVDLIYIDPPFNSNRNYEVFWGETKETRSFDDRQDRKSVV